MLCAGPLALLDGVEGDPFRQAQVQRIPAGKGVDRELQTRLGLLGPTRPAGLVVDQLDCARWQAIYAINDTTDDDHGVRVQLDPESETQLLAHGFELLGRFGCPEEVQHGFGALAPY